MHTSCFAFTSTCLHSLHLLVPYSELRVLTHAAGSVVAPRLKQASIVTHTACPMALPIQVTI